MYVYFESWTKALKLTMTVRWRLWTEANHDSGVLVLLGVFWGPIDNLIM